MQPVNLVIRSHHSPRPRALDRKLERQQVNLPQCTRRHQRTDRHTLMLLVIAHQMLQRRHNPAILDTRAIARRREPREDRVLGERLEPAPAQGTPLDIDGRAEEDVCAFGSALGSEELAQGENQVPVEGCAECGPAGETGRGNAVEVACAAGAVGAVGCAD